MNGCLLKAQIALLRRELSQEGIAKQKKDLVRVGLGELQLEQEELEQSLGDGECREFVCDFIH